MSYETLRRAANIVEDDFPSLRPLLITEDASTREYVIQSGTQALRLNIAQIVSFTDDHAMVDFLAESFLASHLATRPLAQPVDPEDYLQVTDNTPLETTPKAIARRITF